MTRPKISVYIGQSLDGFIARPDGGLDFLHAIDTSGEDHGYFPFYETVDAIVAGRGTYDVVQAFPEWPWAGKRVIICTNRPLDAKHGEETHAGTLAPLMDRLGREGVRRVYLDGGATIRRALNEGLVDDMTITTLPMLIGAGLPLFGGTTAQERWTLVRHAAFPSGFVQSTYERADG
jgi:dihydrofolate reductase